MAKKNEEVIVGVDEVYSKTEQYIEENKNSLTIIIIAIAVIIGGYFAYKKLHLAPLELEAQEQMWKAVQYFEKDSFNLAINGDGINFGFEYIVEEFGSTKTGNLAHYYLGICYLNIGKYEEAIEYLNNFNADDQVVAPIAQGAIGDAYMELNDFEEALSYYEDAAEMKTNDFTTPIFLMKAAFASEQLGDYSKAKKFYTRIKKDFSETNEGRNVDKYLARAASFAK